jgi:hypothetical protein
MKNLGAAVALLDKREYTQCTEVVNEGIELPHIKAIKKSR